jgi:hypothetical protein
MNGWFDDGCLDPVYVETFRTFSGILYLMIMAVSQTRNRDFPYLSSSFQLQQLHHVAVACKLEEN